MAQLETVAGVVSSAQAIAADQNVVTITEAVIEVVTTHAGDVADMAGQVVAGLLALADRFPLASACGGVLRDLCSVYQVCFVIITTPASESAPP